MILKSEKGLTRAELQKAVQESLPCQRSSLRRVLLIPPDYTRMYSGAGLLTALYVEWLSPVCSVDVMPALGTHVPMTREECAAFFGESYPYERLLVHNWRKDVCKIGEVPASFVREVSEGLVDETIDVELNRRIVNGGYDLIISIGQVVPHEVVGMANYSKNLFVGCGGASMINASHMLGAFYGMERIMGRDGSPVRRVFDYAEEHFLRDIPLLYVLTCTTNTGDRTDIHGLFIGRDRALFEEAVRMSQRLNLTHLAHPLQKAVVYLDPREFKSTWLGNKAIYRTRMAMADGGELVILGPGLCRFGEDGEVDRLIRKYGYCGRQAVLDLCKTEPELRENLSVAAHLIHGSSDGRFRVTLCTKELSAEEVTGAGFSYMPYEEASALYNPAVLQDGFCNVNGEEIFYISNPALGLWVYDGDSYNKGEKQ